jgi:hypothetical protein
MLAAGAITVAAGELLFAAAPPQASMFVMRVPGGFGDALFYTAVTASVVDAVRPELVTRALSVLTSCMCAGMLAGPVAGEAIRAALGYQPVWWGAAGLSTVTVIAGTAVPRHRPLLAAVTRMGSCCRRPPDRPSPEPVRDRQRRLGRVYELRDPLRRPAWPAQGGDRVCLSRRRHRSGPAGSRWLVERAGLRLSAAGFLPLAGCGLLAAATWPAGAALLAVAQALGFPVVMQLAVGQMPAGGRTGVVAAVTAGYDIGYGAAAVRRARSPVTPLFRPCSVSRRW